MTAAEADNDAWMGVSAGAGGTVSLNGATVVTQGAATPIIATAGAGYAFVNWTVLSGAATFANATAASTTVTVAVAATVQANFTPAGGNQPPTTVSAAWADANPVTLPAGTSVHVVANDPDGDPLTYAWSKQSGAGTATFATPDATASGVTFSAAGAYVLRVAVSDGNGGRVTSDVSVAVTSDVDARADCNGDGVVNALDLQIVIANFGQTVP